MILASATTTTYPLPSKPVLRTLAMWADVFNLPLDWLVATSFIESTHDPRKVNMSPAAARKGGAWGLLQQMGNEAEYKIGIIKKFYTSKNSKTAQLWKSTPANIRRVKQTLARWKGKPSDLQDLTLNTLLGAWQLARLRRVFGDNFPIIMAAYHQGETAVKNRLSAGLVPVDPIKQPAGADYVDKALEARASYANL